MMLLKAIAIALILLIMAGFHDFGRGKWYGNGRYTMPALGLLLTVDLLYIILRR